MIYKIWDDEDKCWVTNGKWYASPDGSLCGVYLRFPYNQDGTIDYPKDVEAHYNNNLEIVWGFEHDGFAIYDGDRFKYEYSFIEIQWDDNLMSFRFSYNGASCCAYDMLEYCAEDTYLGNRRELETKDESRM